MSVTGKADRRIVASYQKVAGVLTNQSVVTKTVKSELLSVFFNINVLQIKAGDSLQIKRHTSIRTSFTMELSQILLGIIAIAFCISSAHSLKCFQCNSAENEDCLTVHTNQTDSPFYKECNETIQGHKAFCRKTVLNIIDAKYKRIVRACGWELYKGNETGCYERDSDFKLERSCQCFTDGCNSATNILLPSVVALTFLSAVLSRFS